MQRKESHKRYRETTKGRATAWLKSHARNGYDRLPDHHVVEWWQAVKPATCQVPGCSKTRLSLDVCKATGVIGGWFCDLHNGKYLMAIDMAAANDADYQFLSRIRNKHLLDLAAS